MRWRGPLSRRLHASYIFIGIRRTAIIHPFLQSHLIPPIVGSTSSRRTWEYSQTPHKVILPSSVCKISLDLIKMTDPSPRSKAAPIYLGFGSNMWKQQVKTRCHTSKYLGIARLSGYRWFIAAQGGANIAKGSDADEVWGLAYALQPEDEAKLDVIERPTLHAVICTVVMPSSHASLYVCIKTLCLRFI